MFVSAIFIAIGAVTVPSGISDASLIGFVLIILGSIGMAIKEALGAAPTPAPTP